MDFDVIVIGSGAAAFNAACRIAQGGRKSVCIVTEGVRTGTSRNTGSDKQTYYKLNLGASQEDSVRKMAEDLFACGCVDGDTAFCEAALSARCFLRLVELGVPFPQGPYGEYPGYKTDHDPCARASSAGPLAPRFMTEALEREAARLGVPVYDQMYVTEILKDGNGVCGVAAVRTDTGAFCALRCRYAVLATGGPAGIYADSVYPACHTGSTSLAAFWRLAWVISSSSRMLGLSRKMRAIISRCIWPPESSKGYLLVSSANFRFTNEQASVIISIFFSFGRFLPPRMLMQSSSTLSILWNTL